MPYTKMILEEIVKEKDLVQDQLVKCIGKIDSIEKDQRLRIVLPYFFGLKNLLRPGYNNTYQKITILDTYMKEMESICKDEGIKYKYEEYELGVFKNFITRPHDTYAQSYPIKEVMWVGAM